VVERAIGLLGPPPKSQPRAQLLDPFMPFVLDTLQQYPRLRATRLLRMLQARGYAGSIRTLRRHVAQVRPARRREVFLRTETLPGEQAQIDWAHAGSLRIGTFTRPLWLFVMVLKYSRAIWAEFVLDLTAYSLRRSLVRAAQYFGGVTRQWLFDNAKTVVVDRHGDVVRFHPLLLELCAQMLVQAAVCGVREPQQKGGVERAIRYLRDAFLAARHIHSIEHGNAQLLTFLEEVTLLRPHPVQDGRSVGDVLQEEKSRLLALPEVLPPTDELRSVVADKTAFVSFDTNRYSVPVDQAHKTLSLLASDTHLRLLDGDQLVAEHSRCWLRKSTLELPAHRKALLDHKRAARQNKGRDRLHSEVPRIDELLQLWADDGRFLGTRVARTCKLLDVYGPRTVASAVAELLNRGSHDYGALAILCEKRRVKPHVALPLQLAEHVQDRDVIPHDLGGYDD
jgi:transposase